MKKIETKEGTMGLILFCLLLTTCYCGVCALLYDLILGPYYHWRKIYPLYACSTFMHRSVVYRIMPKHPRGFPFFQCIIYSCRSYPDCACTRDSYLDWRRIGEIIGCRAFCHLVSHGRHVWVRA